MDDSNSMDYEIGTEAQVHAQRIAFSALVAIIDDGEPNGLAATLSRVLASLSESIEIEDVSAALRDISNAISDH
ncbi:MAG: hypothetical protein GJ676_09035 [Rhodobacteraceae bacterium]|nr:hypothetical protein [Paracoccaceae bacterium]